MSLYRLLLLRSLRQRSTAPSHVASSAISFSLLPSIQPEPSSSLHHTQNRTFAFSSAEEAAAERRRRKRRLRIEPPLHALRRDNYPPPPRDPNAPRLPDSTSSLVGPRLNLHNRVQSLIRAGDLDAASVVARQSMFSNTRPTVFTCNAIIASMYRAKRYTDAIALFQFFFNQFNIVPNVVSYNNLINTHCDMGNVDTALEVYRLIIANAPFSPSSVTYRHLTKGMVDVGRIDEAVDLLREMLNKGGGADSLVYNNLISGFLKLENLDKANELFDELKSRCLVYDGVVNATYMDWFFNQGREKEAMESYKSLLDKQFRMVPATCNVLIEVLLKHGKTTEAWAMFEQMLDNHKPPNFQAVNSDTFNLMVNECFKNGKFDEAIATFRKVGTAVGSRPFSMDVAGYTNIITRYCEHGMLTEADNLFKELVSKSLSPDVGSHRALIDAYLKAGKIDDALAVFQKMVDSGLRVVASFGNRVFEELIGNGKTLDCAQILTKMGDKDPKPDPTCYEVVIRGLCNENAMDAALDLIGQVIKYSVGLTPSLREFITEAFKNVGRGEELERLLSMDRGPRPQQQHRRPPPNQFNGPVRASPMATPPPPGNGNPQAFRHMGPSQSQVFGQQGTTEFLKSKDHNQQVDGQGTQSDMSWKQSGQFQVAARSMPQPTPQVGLNNGHMAGPPLRGEPRQFYGETQQPKQQVHGQVAWQYGAPQTQERSPEFGGSSYPSNQMNGSPQYGGSSFPHQRDEPRQFNGETQQHQQQVHEQVAQQYGAPHTQERAFQFGGSSYPHQMNGATHYSGSSFPPSQINRSQFDGYSNPPPLQQMNRSPQFDGYSNPPSQQMNRSSQFDGYSNLPPQQMNRPPQFDVYSNPPPQQMNAMSGSSVAAEQASEQLAQVAEE